MNFEEEAFISYAHLDNQELIEGRKGWVSDFHRALKIRLGELLGKDPRIWRDPKLQGNDSFPDTLSEKLQNVAAFLPILSPRYVKSEWTRRELSGFCAAAEKSTGLCAGDKARIFKILKTPIPLDEHPPELQSLLGYEFFKIDEETGRVRELSEIFGPELQGEFWIKVGDLAHDLCELLKNLEDSEPPPKEPAVYVAEATRDQTDARELVRRNLKQHLHPALPSQSLPLVQPDLTKAVQEQLSHCRASIHLIGKNYGAVPEGGSESLPEIQNRLAAERALNGDFARLVWIPPGLQVEDERQREFIRRLRMDSGFQNGSDLLETPLEKLQTALFDRLNPPPKAPKIAANDAKPPAALARIYLVFDQRDQDAVQPWAEHLFNQGLEVLQSGFDGTETDIREYHEENLRICDAVLIHYGAGNEIWLRKQLREVQKAPGYGRAQPMRAVAVALAPPKTAQKQYFRTHEAMVLAQLDGFEAGALRPFVDLLKKEAVKETGANAR
ncbi:MAG TPA: toll/interleukin-1 receptor domain-containing protein [Bryobacteraceae bacterium]|jgi:hypothetical protein